MYVHECLLHMYIYGMVWYTFWLYILFCVENEKELTKKKLAI